MNTTSWHDYVVAKVDKLVSDILTPNIQINDQEICEQLNTYYQLMRFHYNNELVYTNSIKWFMGSCYYVCGNHYSNEIIWDKIMAQRFSQRIKLYKYEFFTAKNNFTFQEERNSRSLSKYIKCLFGNCSRLLIVRVDVKIKVESAHLINIETYSGFMTKLMKKIQDDKEKEKKRKKGEIVDKEKGCFEGLRGYAWAIEQGVDTGALHCHLLLLYNGNERKQDWYLGDAVGKRWVDITEGLGWYFNCNTIKYKQEQKRKGKLGIGMIHRDNLVEVDKAINAAMYLTSPDKYEQRLKAKLPYMRTFGHGIIS